MRDDSGRIYSRPDRSRSSRAAALLLAIVVLTGAAGAGQSPARDAAAAAIGSSTIRGRVLAGPAEPLRNARLTIAGGSAHRPVVSDADGRFAFTQLAPGRYVITAEKTGFARTRYGAKGALDPAMAIEVPAASVVTGIDLIMTRGAAISGRVVDDLSEPQVGMTVIASRVLRAGGRVHLEAAAYTQTDDQGDYRLFGLTEGRYVVDVSAIPATAEGLVSGRVLSIGAPGPGGPVFGRTYYPGVAVLSEAQPVAVRTGDDLDGIDIRLAPAVAPAVSLSVSDGKGEPASGTFAIVPVPSYSSFARSGSISAGQGAATVEPGEWVAIVRGNAGTAFSPLTVGTDDVSVRLVLGPGGSLSGRAVAEAPSTLRAGSFQLEAVPLEGEAGPFGLRPAVASVAADGAFTLTGLIGSRELRLRAPPGWRIKALVAGDRDLLDGPLEIAGSDTVSGARLLLTQNRSTLRGFVSSGAVPAIAASVIAFPQDRGRWRLPGRWARWIKTGTSGEFAIDDLPAADYFVVSVADVDATSWSSAEALDRLVPLAARVTTSDGGTAVVNLELVSP